jgi:glycosyltransferase involved in cell wall biosynthesis
VRIADDMPRVSVLLPTWNRAAFLPAAFDALRAQTCADWELIVVDDGSTDDTAAVVRRLGAGLARPLVYVKQPNAGAYGARNTALARATAPAVAFYDSDDLWLPHHLEQSLRALDEAPDVDWVYAACRMVDHATGRVLASDTFRLNGAPRPFRQLRTRRTGALHVLDDPRTLECALRHGLYCGLQNSVIRRAVFAAGPFRTTFRNEGEDQLFLMRALKRGTRIGYLDDIHVEYRVHDANSSGSATDRRPDRELSVYLPLARGFEELLGEFAWRGRERRALARRLAREHFWHVGYAVLWKNGRRREALDEFKAGLRVWPWSLACWKTYLLARLRLGLG